MLMMLPSGAPDEESPHAPRLVGERMDDLVPAPAGLVVCDVGPTWTEMTESCGALASPVTSWTHARPSAEAYLATQPRFIASTLSPRYSR
jgi:hypothetical protein